MVQTSHRMEEKRVYPGWYRGTYTQGGIEGHIPRVVYSQVPPTVRMASYRAYGQLPCVWPVWVRMASMGAYGQGMCVWPGYVRMARLYGVWPGYTGYGQV